MIAAPDDSGGQHELRAVRDDRPGDLARSSGPEATRRPPCSWGSGVRCRLGCPPPHVRPRNDEQDRTDERARRPMATRDPQDASVAPAAVGGHRSNTIRPEQGRQIQHRHQEEPPGRPGRPLPGENRAAQTRNATPEHERAPEVALARRSEQSRRERHRAAEPSRTGRPDGRSRSRRGRSPRASGSRRGRSPRGRASRSPESAGAARGTGSRRAPSPAGPERPARGGPAHERRKRAGHGADDGAERGHPLQRRVGEDIGEQRRRAERQRQRVDEARAARAPPPTATRPKTGALLGPEPAGRDRAAGSCGPSGHRCRVPVLVERGRAAAEERGARHERAGTPRPSKLPCRPTA